MQTGFDTGPEGPLFFFALWTVDCGYEEAQGGT